MMIKTHLLVAACAATLLVGCYPKQAQYHGLSTMQRAEVSLTRFAHDMRIDAGKAPVNDEEQTRLVAFLDRIGIRYGDTIQLDTGAVGDNSDIVSSVDAALYPHGLSVLPTPIAIGDVPAAQTVRVVVTRHLAKGPPCPNHAQPNTPNYENAPSANYSCANRTNLAAQVANPAHLVAGVQHAGTVQGEPERAINDFRTRTMSGTQGLANTSTGDSVAAGQ